jgi:DNA-directed RNA polymerase specialized sigma24 family protein
MAPSSLTEAELEELVARSRTGDEDAWQALWPEVARVVERAAGRSGVLGPLARSADERADVVVDVMEELRRDDFRLLGAMGKLLGQRDGSWRHWLSAVAVNAARNHVRTHPDYLRWAEGGGRRWASYAALPEGDEDDVLSDGHGDAGLDMTRRVEAHLILAWARAELSPAQLAALVPWLHDAEPAATAAEQRLAGGADEAVHLVRAAVRRLRRAFGEEGEGPVSPDLAPHRASSPGGPRRGAVPSGRARGGR